MKNVLLVVDMLNDFCKKGGVFYDENLEAIIPAVEKHIKKRIGQGWNVVVVSDFHRKDDLEIKLLGEHAMAGTWGGQIVDVLSFLHREQNIFFVSKTTFDPILGGLLEELITKLKPAVVEAIGVCTDICVFHTVSSLVSWRNSGKLIWDGKSFQDIPWFEVVIYEDCVATFDDNEYKGYIAEEKTKFVFYHLEKWFGVKIANSQKIPQLRKKGK